MSRASKLGPTKVQLKAQPSICPKVCPAVRWPLRFCSWENVSLSYKTRQRMRVGSEQLQAPRLRVWASWNLEVRFPRHNTSTTWRDVASGFLYFVPSLNISPCKSIVIHSLLAFMISSWFMMQQHHALTVLNIHRLEKRSTVWVQSRNLFLCRICPGT